MRSDGELFDCGAGLSLRRTITVCEPFDRCDDTFPTCVCPIGGNTFYLVRPDTATPTLFAPAAA
jgi:hypothetical protein